MDRRIMAVMTGPDLRAARKRLGFNQTQLGAAIGRSQQTISHFENGAEPIPRVVELAISALLFQQAASCPPE
jgi:DNA-binding XRE family transcriptional regulator